MNVMNYGDRKSIGSVEFAKGEIYVGDPSYDPEDLEKLTIKPGRYEFFICKDRDCNSALGMSLNGRDYNGSKFVDCEKEFCVDSGQGGIFEAESFNSDEVVADCKKYNYKDKHSEFFKAMSYFTFEEEDSAGVYPKGAVSSSGYGDGAYNIYIVENNDGEIVAITLAFIEDGRSECCRCSELFADEELDDNGYCYHCAPDEEEEQEEEVDEEEEQGKYW